jgi:hypothetical protein
MRNLFILLLLLVPVPAGAVDVVKQTGQYIVKLTPTEARAAAVAEVADPNFLADLIQRDINAKIKRQNRMKTIQKARDVFCSLPDAEKKDLRSAGVNTQELCP